MNLLIRAILAIATLTGAFLASAQAADPWYDFAAQLRTTIKGSNASIVTMATKIRDVRCPQQATLPARTACVAAYNVTIARMEAARAELELKLAAVALPPDQRDSVLKSLDGYDALNKETNGMVDQFDSFFPIPRQSSEK